MAKEALRRKGRGGREILLLIAICVFCACAKRSTSCLSLGEREEASKLEADGEEEESGSIAASMVRFERRS